MSEDWLFDVLTPLGFRVHVTQGYWQIITTIKHPIMAGREEDVKATLTDPEEIRQSKTDPDVYLFYKPERLERWICAVTKKENELVGFLITTYPTDAVKEGETIWHK